MSGVAGSVKFQRYFSCISWVRAVLGKISVWGAEEGLRFPSPPAPHTNRGLLGRTLQRGPGYDLVQDRSAPSRHDCSASWGQSSPSGWLRPRGVYEGFSRRRSDGRIKDFAHSGRKGSATNALEMGRTRAKRWPSWHHGDTPQGEA